jgi:hypothetical protein
MTIDPVPSPPPADPLDLLHYVDCVVMLLPAGATDGSAAALWAQGFARRIRVVEVTLGGPDTTEPKSSVEGRLVRLTLPSTPPPDRNEVFNQTLRQLGLLRPLLWLEDSAHALWFCTSFAPFKAVVLRRQDTQGLLPSLLHADAVYVASDAVAPAELPGAVRDRCRALSAVPTESAISEFCRLASQFISRRPAVVSRLNIAVLYDQSYTFTNTVREHLESFARFSRHRVFYVPASRYHPRPPTYVDLSIFDVIIIHYSIRLCFDTLLPAYDRELMTFGGLKACFIQDEYDHTEIARRAFERFGLHVVFTCVPDAYRDRIYARERFPHVDFVQVLTGYVPSDLVAPRESKLFRERKFVIGYRGRALAPWYGDLSREKLLIGQRVREVCQARGISVDIEWDEDHRIYGEDWYDFMRDCRATLGTESGSNVFDDHGDIRQAIQRALRRDPDLSYEAIHARFLSEHDGRVQMNQISPRVFEAIALRTALVLFEGTYSGVIAPERHYIPLKKDLSNIDEVLERLADDTYLEGLTSRAWEDIVGSGRYSYQAFVDTVDAVIARQGYRGSGRALLTAVVATRSVDERQWQWLPTDRALATYSAFTTELIDHEQTPPPLPSDVQIVEASPRPANTWQALKWGIADVLYPHAAVYQPMKAIYRGGRSLLRRAQRGLSGHSDDTPAPGDQPTGDLTDSRS